MFPNLHARCIRACDDIPRGWRRDNNNRKSALEPGFRFLGG
jgi:hypothetical protein